MITKIMRVKFNPTFIFLFTIFFISCFISQLTYAEIFRCNDHTGKTIFKDSECSDKETEVDKIIYVNNPQSSSEDIKKNDSLKVLYKGSRYGTETRFVRVAIYEESESHLMLEVTGYFSGTPKGKLQFRVVPNTKWSYSGDVSTTKRGFVTAYTRIALNSSANDIEKSDILSLQLWHYFTEKGKSKANRLKMLTVPYKKEWVK